MKDSNLARLKEYHVKSIYIANQTLDRDKDLINQILMSVSCSDILCVYNIHLLYFQHDIFSERKGNCRVTI